MAPADPPPPPTSPAQPYGAQAAVYDFEYRDFDQDVALLRQRLWQRGVSGALLELGCGTGRVALPLAAAGYEVVGIDLSAPMLQRGHERVAALPGDVAARVTLIAADMCTFDLGRRFGAILAPFGALTLLPDAAARAACLARCRAHAEPGAWLWVDVAAALPGGPAERAFTSRFVDGRGGRRVDKRTVQRRHSDGRAVEISYHYDIEGEAPIVVRFDLALLDETTLLDELDAAGMDVHEIFGDWQGGPSRPGSPRCVVEAKVRT